MKIIATQKFIRMSPAKLRLVSDLVRDLNPQEAIETLPFINKRATEPIRKVLMTAIANAKVKGITDDSQLKIKEIQINEGPRLKRGRPVSRGRWHPYQRKMSHIRVILESAEKKEGKKGGSNKKTTSGKPKASKVTRSSKKVKREGVIKKQPERVMKETSGKKSLSERAKSIVRTRTTNK